MPEKNPTRGICRRSGKHLAMKPERKDRTRHYSAEALWAGLAEGSGLAETSAPLSA